MDNDKKQLIAEMKEEIVLTLKAMMPEMKADVQKEIERTVNGHIREIKSILDDHVTDADDHRKKVDGFMAIMLPAADGIRLLVTLRKFAVWLSGFGVIGTIAWLGLRGLIGR